MASLTENNMYHSLREVVELYATLTFNSSWGIISSEGYGQLTFNVDSADNQVAIRLTQGFPRILSVFAASIETTGDPNEPITWLQSPYLLTDSAFNTLGAGDATNAVAGTTIVLTRFVGSTSIAPEQNETLNVRILLLNTTVTP